MIFSGTDYRKIQEKEDYNFFIDGSINNVTGKAAIGFSGEGEKFNFNLLEGRVIDPSDNYVFSYDTGTLQISGNVNKTNYNYYINDNKINFSGVKNDFKIDRFFIDCSGCNVTIDNFIVKGSGATTFTIQNMESFVGDGRVISGDVITNDASFGRFDIFSGEVLTSTATGLFAIETSLSTGIEATGIIAISGQNNIANQTPYTFEANLYTSFGEVTKTFNVTGTTPFYQPDLTLTASNETISGGLPFVEKTGNYVAEYFLFTGSPTYATGLPISASLSYYTGYTGDITGALTGVTILESGLNYSVSNPPPIIVTGDGEGAQVTGNVSPQGNLSSITIINGGSGYTTPPSFLIYSGINSVAVLEGGTGYFSAPVLEFSGGVDIAVGGTTAQASALLGLNGTISTVTIQNQGSFYSGIPTLNVIPGLSGVSLTSSGSGYSSVPSIFIENGGGSGAAVVALTGDPNSASSGFLVGFDLISGGSGYTGIPNVLVSGGNPSLTGSGAAGLSTGFVPLVSMFSGAIASGSVGDYNKSFSGQFNLLTGSGDSYLNFREAGQITSDNLSYTGEIIQFRENSTLALGVESVLDIRVTNLNFYDSLPLIAQLSVSGSGALPPFVPSDVVTLQVTGIK